MRDITLSLFHTQTTLWLPLCLFWFSHDPLIRQQTFICPGDPDTHRSSRRILWLWRPAIQYSDCVKCWHGLSIICNIVHTQFLMVLYPSTHSTHSHSVDGQGHFPPMMNSFLFKSFSNIILSCIISAHGRFGLEIVILFASGCVTLSYGLTGFMCMAIQLNSVYFVQPNIINYKFASEGFTNCTHRITKNSGKTPKKIEKKLSRGKQGRNLQESNRGVCACVLWSYMHLCVVRCWQERKIIPSKPKNCILFVGTQVCVCVCVVFRTQRSWTQI